MIQAAHSGKQNIVEGTADGITSSEMELKLLNVARSSIMELREDYEDYLRARGLPIWNEQHHGYDKMLNYCREHNRVEDYLPYLPKITDEKIANLALTLCHMVDKMMFSYQQLLEKRFVTEGGIRERMTSARIGYRNGQKEEVEQLRQKVQRLEMENQLLRKENKDLKARLGI